MINVKSPPTQTFRSAFASSSTAGSRSRLALELRIVAEDMAGRVDRDELTYAEEIVLADALEAAVAAVLPQVVDALDDALTPRLESLPLHARLTLARARGRNEYGVG
jgi:hypothetical protein